jgi:hypothetical protein
MFDTPQVGSRLSVGTDDAMFILSHVGWHVRRVLDWIIGFITPYTFTKPGTTGNTAQSTFCTLSSSPLYTH